MTRSWLVLVCLSTACLPEDTRPEPGTLVVTVAADAALEAGFVTHDGWAIAYDQFLLSFGRIQAAPRDGVAATSDDCIPYAEVTTYYERIFDLLRPGTQTVVTLYTRGACSLGYQLSPPSDRSVLGAGVHDDDRRALLEHASDLFVDRAPVVLAVAGTAERSGARLHFAWAFRQSVHYERCAEFTLRAGEVRTAGIVIRGAELFRDARDSELRFDPFAAADGDGNLEIDLDELARVPNGTVTLANELYFDRVPRLPEPSLPECEIHPLP